MGQGTRVGLAISSGTEAIEVLVAGEYPVVRFGARHMLEDDPQIDVVGEAGSEADLCLCLSAAWQGVVLLDACTPGLRERQWLRAMWDVAPAAKVLLFTGDLSPGELLPLFAAGVHGAIRLNAEPEQLNAALHAVAAGQFWVGGSAVDDWAPALADPAANGASSQAAAAGRNLFSLTPRELDMVRCIVEGCSNRDAAQRFGISEETVKRHLSNAFDKTGVSTRLELALFAIAHHLIAPEAA